MTQEFINIRILEQLRYLSRLRLKNMDKMFEAIENKTSYNRKRFSEIADSAEAQLYYFEGLRANLEHLTTIL